MGRASRPFSTIFLAALVVWSIDAVCAEKNLDFDAKKMSILTSKNENRENADSESLINSEASQTIFKQSAAKMIARCEMYGASWCEVRNHFFVFDCAFGGTIAHVIAHLVAHLMRI